MTGRLTPVRVESRGPNGLTVPFAAEIGDAFWRNSVKIDVGDPIRVVHAGLGTADRPPEFAIPRMPCAEPDRATTRKPAEDVAAGRFAGRIIAARRGRVVYRNASGLADRAARKPVNIDSKSRIGSADKMFTAVGVPQPVE